MPRNRGSNRGKERLLILELIDPGQWCPMRWERVIPLILFPMLRRKLQEMTDVSDVSQHPALLEALTHDFPNSIRILESAFPIRRYTCLMYVFDFTEKPEYLEIAGKVLSRVFAGTSFLHWLLANKLLVEVSPSAAKDGDLVLYFDEGRFKHAGLSLGESRVRSKWGIGHLFEHELLEVPESYGSEVRFFKKPAYASAIAYFVRFAKENGDTGAT